MLENKLLLKLKKLYLFDKKKFFIYTSLSLFLVLAISIYLRTYFVERYYFALNPTPSLTESMFLVDKNTNIDELKRDDIIGFTYKHSDYPFYKYNQKFIKYVVCLEGDDLIVEPTRVTCNGKYLGSQIKQDSFGNVLPKFSFNGKVPKDKYFVWTPFVKSYDSRYWGFVDRKDILGKAIWKY